MDIFLLVVLGLFPLIAKASEGELQLHELYSMGTFLLVNIFAIFGGIVSYITGFARNPEKKFRIVELLSEMSASAFSGMITFLLATEAGYGTRLTMFLVAMSGHLGTKGLFFLGKVYKKIIDRSSIAILGEASDDTKQDEK